MKIQKAIKRERVQRKHRDYPIRTSVLSYELSQKKRAEKAKAKIKRIRRQERDD